MAWTTITTAAGSGVSASADGSKLLTASGNFINISADWGATWIAVSAPTNLSDAPIVVSADGSQLVVGAYGDHIYKLNSSPKPDLNIVFSPSGANISWIVPSQDFVLQRNSGLSKIGWIDIQIAPVLNLTTLQNQITIPSPTGATFYRLVSR
jgi:hypothetical protein